MLQQHKFKCAKAKYISFLTGNTDANNSGNPSLLSRRTPVTLFFQVLFRPYACSPCSSDTDARRVIIIGAKIKLFHFYVYKYNTNTNKSSTRSLRIRRHNAGTLQLAELATFCIPTSLHRPNESR